MSLREQIAMWRVEGEPQRDGSTDPREGKRRKASVEPSGSPSSQPLALSRAYLAISAAAVVMSIVALRTAPRKLIWDAAVYHDIAKWLGSIGLFSFRHPDRSYGYPLFVAVAGIFSDGSEYGTRVAVYLLQLFLFLATCAIGANRLGKLTGSRTAALLLFAFTALNPYLLVATTDVLSDLLSSSLIYLAVVFAFPLPQRRDSVDALLSTFCASTAMIVRPANAAVFAAVAGIWFLRLLLSKRRRILPIVLAAAVGLVPLFPQVYGNYKYFGIKSPLIKRKLYGEQAALGIRQLKYATSAMPQYAPPVVYSNPLFTGDARSAPEFLKTHPFRYAATLALRSFALVDYDYIVTYVSDRSPWYRWPLSQVNYAFLLVAILGVADFRRRFAESSPNERFAHGALLITVALYTVAYLPTRVENRFSLPLFLLLAPFAVRGAREGAAFAKRRPAAAAAVLVSFLAVCSLLSFWIQSRATWHPV